jgi:hypothetical protein
VSGPWWGVDLDGTLAHYEGWKGEFHIGPPIPAMRDRVIEWLAKGREVRIFTARVGPRSGGTKSVEDIIQVIQLWCVTHIGVPLPVTCTKDFGMIEIWDDRAVQVIPNTGMPVDGGEESLRAWIAANAPGGWIDNLRERVKALEAELRERG